MPTPPRPESRTPAELEAWLDELGLKPVDHAERDGVSSWDLVLDGRRRARMRVTLILDPALALICWAHFAPPINDLFRKSYRKLLRWNDELPFVKFSISEDERPVLVAELPAASLDRDVVGRALARQVAVADRLHDEALDWLKTGGWPTGAPTSSLGDLPGWQLLERYAADVAELTGDTGTGPA